MELTTEMLEELKADLASAKALFPNDEALTKALFLAYRDLSKKWIKPVKI